MRTLMRALTMLVAMGTAGVAARAAEPTSEDFKDEVLDAAQALIPVRQRAEMLILDGKVDEANGLLRDHFPAAKRTPAQAFIVGNLLFRADPKASRELHEEAVRGAPGAADAQFGFAMEEHRAGNYAEALAAYKKCSAQQPDWAKAHGLAAECAIRLGAVAEAVELWKKSEAAPVGSIEQFEALVCDVHDQSYLDGTRQDLLQQMVGGDEAAAVALLALASTWRNDWWHDGPETKRLQRDLAEVKRRYPDPGRELRVAIAMSTLLVTEEADPAKVRASLVAAGCPLDGKAPLPRNADVLALVLQAATGLDGLAALREKVGPQVIALARETKQAEAFTAAAYLYLGSPRMAEIDQEGWEATHDARFAVSRVSHLHLAGKLKLDDPLLARALREFPENSEIALLAVGLAQMAKKPLEPYLVAAIKAEFTEFSITMTGVARPRPSARMLRGYFKLLEQVRAGAR